ncbi:Hypothetical protein CINCED_3A002871 [Cinara cedri]|uniref:Uncharacterized protein n=1 Tax=Cinara cedri TaxID=506608 RepID=A0A5E4NMM9_9HEMI|nr:Hypothetical protein CINCED_3A002871 [Cinara cedri]
MGPTVLYELLQARLVDVFADTRLSRIRALIKPGGLGVRRPSQMLREMRESVAGGLSEQLLTDLWLQKLPANVHAVTRTSMVRPICSRYELTGLWRPVRHGSTPRPHPPLPLNPTAEVVWIGSRMVSSHLRVISTDSFVASSVRVLVGTSA